MTRFIYKGFYYPVIGERNIWRNGTYRIVMSRRFGGWENADKWWSFSYGIKVRLFNSKKPYFQFVIDAINNHEEMYIVKYYYNDYGEISNKFNSTWFTWGVYHSNDDIYKRNHYIGNIADGYRITNLTDLRSTREGSTICVGYDKKKEIAYGWSHLARAGFNIGDKIYDESYDDPYEYPQNHGYKVCLTYEDQMLSAMNYAQSVS